MTFSSAAIIDGKEQIIAGEGRPIPAVNPATGEVTGELREAGQAGVDLAVGAAARSFGDGRWRGLAPWTRQEHLAKLASLMEREAETIARADCIDMGKPISAALGDVAVSAGYTRFYAELLTKRTHEVLETPAGMMALTKRVPRGVVGAITPWNFPFYCAVMKAVPAMAAGNSVVLKPSELSAQSALILARLVLEAGIPDGVLNVIPGTGAVTGRELVRHSEVDFIAFTGSTRTGRAILGDIAQSGIKASMLECGGKSPHLLFADFPDLDFACEAIAADLLRNSGQVCSVGSRLIVERSIHDRVTAAIADIFSKIVPGDPLNPLTSFGPVASERQMASILRGIEGAEAEGARRLCGASRCATPDPNGFFLTPGIFTGVRPEMAIAREELFGPVLAALAVEDETEALQVANGTDYGLVGTVWTGDAARGVRLGEAVRAASVRVNLSSSTPEGPGFAWSGEPSGQSGYGAEGGLAGLHSYMRVQALQLCL